MLRMPTDEVPQLIASRPIHVLVVDDDKMLCEAVQELLEGYGFSVTATTNAFDAIALLEENTNTFDVVMLDATLSAGQSAQSVYQQIRSREPSLPFVIASGYDHAHILQDYPEFEDAIFIQKPWPVAQLVDILYDTLARSRESENESLR